MKPLFSTRFAVPSALAPVVEAGLEAAGIDMVSTENVDRHRTTFDHYGTSPHSARRLAHVLTAALPAWTGRRTGRIRVVALQPRDWTEHWKRFFRTKRVSPRIVIKPSWESYRACPRDCVVEIDPGMSFGTGLHPTTRACLRFLDRLATRLPGASFIDVGCGSGVLVIAAAKLGLQPAMGIDHDLGAIRIARANLRLNGVAREADCLTADAASPAIRGRFTLVCANMFASELERNARGIIGFASTRAESRLLVAGTLTAQYPTIRRMFEKAGFREEKAVREKGWTSACLVRQVPRSTSTSARSGR